MRLFFLILFCSLGLEASTKAPALRPLSPDRPDKTESPISVDKGFFQIEADVANVSFDRTSEGTSTDLILGYSNFKYGLTNKIDFQLMVQSYRRETTEQSGVSEVKDGMGDLTPRLKINFYGNDEGDNALGIILYATLPTWKHTPEPLKKVQYGFSIPVAFDLGQFYSLGGMLSLDRTLMGAEGAFDTKYSTMVALGYDFTDVIGGYFEFFNTLSSTPGVPWVATVDGGLTYMINPNFMWDVGVNIGVTEAADDWNPFTGFTARF